MLVYLKQRRVVMSMRTNSKRRFIQAGLGLPFLAGVSCRQALAELMQESAGMAPFTVPEKIQAELFRLYGEQANSISHTGQLMLKTPGIAENAAVVSVRVLGDKGLVSSVAIFVEQNPQTLSNMFKLHKGADLPVSTRIRVNRTSDVYVIARTHDGLIGTKQTVKVTMGCMGG